LAVEKRNAGASESSTGLVLDAADVKNCLAVAASGGVTSRLGPY
jgi:hypothetical protein